MKNCYTEITEKNYSANYLKRKIRKDILLYISWQKFPINQTVMNLLSQKLNIIKDDIISNSSIEWQVEILGNKPKRTISIIIKINNESIIHSFNCEISSNRFKVEFFESLNKRKFVIYSMSLGVWKIIGRDMSGLPVEVINQFKRWENDSSLQLNDVINDYNKFR